MVVYNQAPIGLGTWSEQNKPYYAFHTTFNIQYQSLVMMDRKFFPTNYNQQQGTTSEVVESEDKAFTDIINSKYSPVSVNISNTYDQQTRAVNVKVSANFCDTATGDLRIYLVLTQDTVKGPGGGEAYGQNCGGSQGLAASLGYTINAYPAGSGFIWAESFEFINPVKYQPSGFFGNAGVIPANHVQGVDYSENFSFTLPTKNSSTEAFDIDPKRIQIIAAVVRKGNFKNRQVLNCNKKYLLANTSSITENNLPTVNFSTALVNENTVIINYSSPENAKAQLHIFNAAGELVQAPLALDSDAQVKSTNINVSQLSNGIYFFSLNVNGSFYTQKVIINK